VRLLDQRGDHLPVEPRVEADADPAAASDVRRVVDVLRLGFDERLLRAFRRVADGRDVAVVVMVVREPREDAAAGEPGRLSMGEFFRRIGKREADFAHALDRLLRRSLHALILRRCCSLCSSSISPPA